MQGRLSLLTFFGEAKKVSAARHERDNVNKNAKAYSGAQIPEGFSPPTMINP